MIISYILIRNHFIQSAIHINKQVEWIPQACDKRQWFPFYYSLENLPHNQGVIREENELESIVAGVSICQGMFLCKDEMKMDIFITNHGEIH